MDSFQYYHYFQDSFDPLTEADLAKLEADLSVAFPADFWRFLLRFNSMRCPHELKFRVRDPSYFAQECYFGSSAGMMFDKRFEEHDIRWLKDCYSDRIPEDFVPIGSSTTGPICMVTSAINHGQINVWCTADELIYFVADGFTHFLSLLYPDKESEKYVEELPVFQAIERGNRAEVLAYLVDGGKVDCRNAAGHTPLMLACWRRWPHIVRLLLESGANPNAEDANGYSPLYHAMKSYSHDSVKLLLAAGGNARFCDDRGMTLVKIAAELSAYRIRCTLEEFLERPAK